jgi:hypothetical protein
MLKDHDAEVRGMVVQALVNGGFALRWDISRESRVNLLIGWLGMEEDVEVLKSNRRTLDGFANDPIMIQALKDAVVRLKLDQPVLATPSSGAGTGNF